eukprot:GHVN01073579.1.p1 GENE.GHVN01073579.1~~GHVN01073579.1.p1  ORF type:complete len:380 (-),score=37.44 GHVN01073579.1:1200-2339(-)
MEGQASFTSLQTRADTVNLTDVNLFDLEDPHPFEHEEVEEPAVFVKPAVSSRAPKLSPSQPEVDDQLPELVLDWEGSECSSENVLSVGEPSKTKCARYCPIVAIVSFAFSFVAVTIILCLVFTAEQTSKQCNDPYVHRGQVPFLRDLKGPIVSVVEEDGKMYVLSRQGRFKHNPEIIDDPAIMVFNTTSGMKLAEFGKNIFASPQDMLVVTGAIWCTDVHLHQVMKFDLDGNELLRLGEKGVPGSDENHFHQPHSVTIKGGRTGDRAKDQPILVADTYNCRVIAFSQDGEFMYQHGSCRNESLEYPHVIPTAISSGSTRIIVGDSFGHALRLYDMDHRLVATVAGHFPNTLAYKIKSILTGRTFVLGNQSICRVCYLFV